MHTTFHTLGGAFGACSNTTGQMETLMIAPFDIFRVEDQDRLIWVSAAGDLETAKAIIKELRTTYQSEYIIYINKRETRCAFIKAKKLYNDMAPRHTVQGMTPSVENKLFVPTSGLQTQIGAFH